MVRWYWSAETLPWQLSIDHYIDVLSVFSWAPKLAKKCESNIGFPGVRTDVRPLMARSRDNQIFWNAFMGRSTYPRYSAGAREARESSNLMTSYDISVKNDLKKTLLHKNDFV